MPVYLLAVAQTREKVSAVQAENKGAATGGTGWLAGWLIV